MNEDGDDIEFWKPIKDPQNMNIIDINEQVKETKFPFLDRVDFWKSLGFSDDYDLPDSLLSTSNSNSNSNNENDGNINTNSKSDSSLTNVNSNSNSNSESGSKV